MEGDIPDESQKAFLLKKFPDLVFLEDEWEVGHVRIWLNSQMPTMGKPHIDPQCVFAYCDKYDLDRVDTLEFVREINMEAYRGERS